MLTTPWPDWFYFNFKPSKWRHMRRLKSRTTTNWPTDSAHSAAYMLQWIGSALVQIMACLRKNIFQWNFIWNSNISIQENAFEHVVCEMAAILPRSRSPLPQASKWQVPRCQTTSSFIFICRMGHVNSVCIDQIDLFFTVYCMLCSQTVPRNMIAVSIHQPRRCCSSFSKNAYNLK